MFTHISYVESNPYGKKFGGNDFRKCFMKEESPEFRLVLQTTTQRVLMLFLPYQDADRR